MELLDCGSFLECMFVKAIPVAMANNSLDHMTHVSEIYSASKIYNKAKQELEIIKKRLR